MPMQESRLNDPRRGEIWLISFEPQLGAEIRKTRPAVVLSLESVGKLALRIVVPFTDWQDQYAESPWLVRVMPDTRNGLAKLSAADAFQVKSVSLQRFVRRLGLMPADAVDEVVDAVALCIGMVISP